MGDKLEVQFKKILDAAQKNRASHQKCLHQLDGIYKKVESNRFKQIFLKLLKVIFATEVFGAKNENVERLLEFVSQFVVQTIPKEESENESVSEDPFEDVNTHPFFTDAVMETLKYHRLANVSLRYNSCLFLRLLLQNISSNMNIDYYVCEKIGLAMLERTADLKSSIRLQAVMALEKLQDPTAPNCPVVTAYLGLLQDANPLIRREVMRRIAPYVGSAPYILRHLRDVDANVRLQAFKRVADMGPKMFKIYERQDILTSGLNETNEKVKKSFQENLLIKWLNAYEGDFIKFLDSIKIDADEMDMLKTQHISKRLMDIYFRIRPIGDVISSLPLNEDKLIPQEKMVGQVILLWDLLVQHVRKCGGDLNIDSEDILPELTPFCNYIQRTIDSAKGKGMEDWEYLEYQHILYSLLEIAEGYDLSDEVGRKTLHQMVMKLLTDEKNHLRIKRKLLKIASELYPKSEDIIPAVCCLISDITEPLIEVEEEIAAPAPTKYDNHDFQVATLKVKLNTLDEEMEDAAHKRDFLKAEQLKEQAQRIREELAHLIESRTVPQVKVQQVKTVKDDPKTVSHCLELLIALLELPTVRSISTALEFVKNEFLLPLLDSTVIDINWRVLQCLALFASLSPDLAEEYVKILCIPLMTCRVVPNYNKFALKVSIKAVADLYYLHGAQIFGGFNENANATQSSNTRRLYDNELEESIADPSKFHFENITDILLDLMDEEDVEIFQYTSLALNRLILNNFPVNPPFIMRIILKWYSPATAKSTNQVQQALGILIVKYVSTVKGAKEIVAKAVLPILRNVAHVPKADPLNEIDTDNLLNYLAVITSSANEKEATDPHLKLSRAILVEVGRYMNPAHLGYLTKMLTLLHIPVGDEDVINRIIETAEKLLTDESIRLDKSSIKYIEKYVQKVKAAVEQKNREKEFENDKSQYTETTDSNTGNNQVESTAAGIENNVAHDAVGVVEDSPDNDMEKESNNTGKNDEYENMINKNNKIIKSVTEHIDSNDDIRSPPRKMRKNGVVDETSQLNNVKEMIKINSNPDTDDNGRPLRKGKRGWKPNKKYEDYRKNRKKINKVVENKAENNSNNEVVENSKSTDTDTRKKVSDNNGKNSSFAEASPLRRSFRHSNCQSQDKNYKRPKDSSSRDSQKESANSTNVSSSFASEVFVTMKRVRSEVQKNGQWKEKAKNGKNMDNLVVNLRKFKDGATNDTKTRGAGKKNKDVSSNKQSFSGDVPIPSRYDMRYCSNRNELDKHKDGKDKDLEPKGSNTTEKAYPKANLHEKAHTSDRKLKKRFRPSFKENKGVNSETSDSESNSTESEVADTRSKRPKLVHLEKQMTRSAKLDSASQNSVLSEHNNTSYRRTFRPIAESTACMLQLSSGGKIIIYIFS
ncbi:unnamed protein product [Acanthoscelides obtectus]|uniref:UVR domain-containing protein n=1 Tax=Acanthoscelides obtectus TaxID=200917 RepID=A0A9P0K1T0_ACAOB|nr:unnamed protein product [Acanthoscelides obtectus]CAK1669939.1 Condensin complex subunit 3 [Acanthoscelides obtectus]